MCYTLCLVSTDRSGTVCKAVQEGARKNLEERWTQEARRGLARAGLHALTTRPLETKMPQWSDTNPGRDSPLQDPISGGDPREKTRGTPRIAGICV